MAKQGLVTSAAPFPCFPLHTYLRMEIQGRPQLNLTRIFALLSIESSRIGNHLVAQKTGGRKQEAVCKK
jgi:hypothetical protein